MLSYQKAGQAQMTLWRDDYTDSGMDMTTDSE